MVIPHRDVRGGISGTFGGFLEENSYASIIELETVHNAEICVPSSDIHKK